MNLVKAEDLLPIAAYFSSKDNCHADMRYVRNLYNTSTTEDQAKQAYKALHLMIVYCPLDVIGMVEATIAEFETRMIEYASFDLSYGEGV